MVKRSSKDRERPSALLCFKMRRNLEHRFFVKCTAVLGRAPQEGALADEQRDLLLGCSAKIKSFNQASRHRNRRLATGSVDDERRNQKPFGVLERAPRVCNRCVFGTERPDLVDE